MSVADASQLCAAKRTDCVLVVDDEEGLSGIFTAKDLAFRVSPSFRHRPLADVRLLLKVSTLEPPLCRRS
jgi:CBS domain-containing protein